MYNIVHTSVCSARMHVQLYACSYVHVGLRMCVDLSNM